LTFFNHKKEIEEKSPACANWLARVLEECDRVAADFSPIRG